MFLLVVLLLLFHFSLVSALYLSVALIPMCCVIRRTVHGTIYQITIKAEIISSCLHDDANRMMKIKREQTFLESRCLVYILYFSFTTWVVDCRVYNQFEVYKCITHCSSNRAKKGCFQIEFYSSGIKIIRKYVWTVLNSVVSLHSNTSYGNWTYIQREWVFHYTTKS